MNTDQPESRTHHISPLFTRLPWIDLLKFFLVVSAGVWLLLRGSERLGYYWQWYRVPRYLFFSDETGLHAGLLIDGLWITLKITGISLLLAFAFGLTTAFLRLSDSYIGRLTARLYMELIRNTPLLVQLFFIYFVLAPIFEISRFTSAVLALSLFEGAYASEIFRAGIVSIDQGQWEASYSLGMNTFNTYRYIILPQAVRRILPPLTSQGISLIKDSALVSTIALYDLTMQGQAIVSETFLTFEIWFTIAAVYLMLTIPLSLTVNWMDKMMRTDN